MDDTSWIVGGLFVLVFFGALYFLPTIIAARKKKPNTTAIFLVNLLFGWTFLGWIVALIWAVSNGNPLQQNIYINGNSSEGGQVMEVSNTRPCPYCAERIKNEAIKCRFCGEMVQKAETVS